MKLIHSFGYALRGIKTAFAYRNARIQFVVAIVVTIAGMFFSLSATEWAILFLCFGLVLSAELMNTAIEKTCDALRAVHHDAYPQLGQPKDIAAGAVLLASLVTVLVGICIFWPHLAHLQ